MEEDSSEEIKITYETLYEMVRMEKSRDDLQQLIPDFYRHVLEYIREKRELLKKSITGSSHAECNLLIEQQVNNIKKLVRELYERREKKITNLAIMKARMSSNITDFSTMQDTEVEMFNQLTKNLQVFRDNILNNIMQEKYSSIPRETPKEQSEETPEESSEQTPSEPEKSQNIKKITFTQDVKKFMDKSMNQYGPYNEGQEAELPEKLADILIKKGKAK